MAGGDKTVKYSVVVDTDTNADLTSSSLEDLNRRIKNSQDAVKSLGQSYRALRGSSDEVKEAKARLSAAMNEERAKTSAASLALEKQGRTIGDVKNKAKLATDVTKDSTKAYALASVAILAVAAAATTAAVAFGKWAVAAADSQRTNMLLSEAAMGGADNAKNFEQQIDALSQKVRTSKGELRTFAQDIYRSFERSRLSGEGMVDVFNALGQVRAVGNEKGADKLREILERGKNVGRVGIQGNGLGQDELQGSGLTRDDFAKQLAVQTKSSVDAMRQQLALGYVDVNEFAKAARAITEKKWGDTNIKLLESFEVQLEKLKQVFRDLVSGVNIQPLLTGLSDLRDYLKEGSVGAKELKAVFQGAFAILTAPFGGLKLSIRESVDLMVNFALRAELSFLKVELAVLKAVKFMGGWNNTLKILKYSLVLIATAITVLLLPSIGAALAGFAAFAVATAPLLVVPLLIGAIVTEFAVLYDMFKTTDWDFLGHAIVDGIGGGIKKGWEFVKNAVTELGVKTRELLAKIWDSHSPSRVFEKLGHSVPTGIAKGINSGADLVGDSVGRLGRGAISAPVIGAGGGGASSAVASANAGSAKVDLHMHFPNAKNGDDIMKTMQSQSFRAQVTKVFEEMLVGQAVPVMGGQ